MRAKIWEHTHERIHMRARICEHEREHTWEHNESTYMRGHIPNPTHESKYMRTNTHERERALFVCTSAGVLFMRLLSTICWHYNVESTLNRQNMFLLRSSKRHNFPVHRELWMAVQCCAGLKRKKTSHGTRKSPLTHAFLHSCRFAKGSQRGARCH